MSEVADYPYTWEASQNSKGFFQIRFKVKSSSAPENAPVTIIKHQLENIKKAVEDAGFKVQPTEEPKPKKEKKD